jgi:hypothetical protein
MPGHLDCLISARRRPWLMALDIAETNSAFALSRQRRRPHAHTCCLVPTGAAESGLNGDDHCPWPASKWISRLSTYGVASGTVAPQHIYVTALPLTNRRSITPSEYGRQSLVGSKRSTRSTRSTPRSRTPPTAVADHRQETRDNGRRLQTVLLVERPPRATPRPPTEHRSPPAAPLLVVATRQHTSVPGPAQTEPRVPAACHPSVTGHHPTTRKTCMVIGV